MARFHVYGLKQSQTLALDLQSNLLERLNTRMMVPLLPMDDVSASITRLNPRFAINDRPYIMMTQLIGAVSLTEIGDLIIDLSPHSDQITAATDFLFQGF
ncbi:CcdB family protein [Rhizobium jaguaris]|uniref:Toxin CcdB n=1 Tax=Rhizobium jaguaris TaxID=1312183 RepID=A0A387FFN9_9HYPH|nr:CcdB family protein [Rhizobium jaguaris]AYG57698.1 hypothetical protein CCGE525_01850 [Rhizobium jaguaris]